MAEIEERELRDNLANSAVHSIRVQRTAEGYRLFIQLTWKAEEAVLMKQRGGVRYFQSLDKLVKMLSSIGTPIPPLSVVISYTPPDDITE